MFRSPNTPSPGKDSSKSTQSNGDDSGGVDKIEQQIDYTKLTDAEILEKFKNNLVTIPFPGKVRSFNLANAVAMTLGEGMRQLYI